MCILVCIRVHISPSRASLFLLTPAFRFLFVLFVPDNDAIMDRKIQSYVLRTEKSM